MAKSLINIFMYIWDINIKCHSPYTEIKGMTPEKKISKQRFGNWKSLLNKIINFYFPNKFWGAWCLGMKSKVQYFTCQGHPVNRCFYRQKFNRVDLLQHLNIPILPEAFLTFASKSSIGPSCAAHAPYNPCTLSAMKWQHCTPHPEH